MNKYLIRHAESLYNVDRTLVCGQSPHVRLSGKGIRQASRLQSLEFLKQEPVSVSPTTRTISTAQIGLPTMYKKLDIRLLEISRGRWEGLQRADCYTPELLAKFQDSEFSRTWKMSALTIPFPVNLISINRSYAVLLSRASTFDFLKFRASVMLRKAVL